MFRRILVACDGSSLPNPDLHYETNNVSFNPLRCAHRVRNRACKVRLVDRHHLPSTVPRAVLTESAVDPNPNPKYDARNHSLVLFDRGDEIAVQAGEEDIRFLLVSGKPIEEPVAWYGPIVMNAQEKLRQAVTELQSGTFIKHR